MNNLVLTFFFSVHLYLEAPEMLKYLSDYIPGLARSLWLIPWGLSICEGVPDERVCAQ